MTAAKKLDAAIDPVLAALQRLSPKQEAELRCALADIDAGRAPHVTDPDVGVVVAERLRQEALNAECDDLTPEELDELERRLADADAHPERLIPLEKFLADRGMA